MKKAKRKAWLESLGDIAFEAIGGSISGAAGASIEMGIKTAAAIKNKAIDKQSALGYDGSSTQLQSEQTWQSHTWEEHFRQDSGDDTELQAAWERLIKSDTVIQSTMHTDLLVLQDKTELPLRKNKRRDNSKPIKFNTVADPMREVTGSGTISHPKEIQSILSELKEYRIEVVHQGKGMAYAPGIFPGMPGQFIIDEEASYSAWMHEYKHFCDDRDDGFPGMRIFMDTAKCIKREVDAYNVEIEIAKLAGRQDIVDRLEELKANEVSRFEKNTEID